MRLCFFFFFLSPSVLLLTFALLQWVTRGSACPTSHPSKSVPLAIFAASSPVTSTPPSCATLPSQARSASICAHRFQESLLARQSRQRVFSSEREKWSQTQKVCVFVLSPSPCSPTLSSHTFVASSSTTDEEQVIEPPSYLPVTELPPVELREEFTPFKSVDLLKIDNWVHTSPYILHDLAR